MSHIVNCPSCSRKLRVPDQLVGKLVKCPTCDKTFTASADLMTPETPVAPVEVGEAPSPAGSEPEVPAPRKAAKLRIMDSRDKPSCKDVAQIPPDQASQ